MVVYQFTMYSMPFSEMILSVNRTSFIGLSLPYILHITQTHHKKLETQNYNIYVRDDPSAKCATIYFGSTLCTRWWIFWWPGKIVNHKLTSWRHSWVCSHWELLRADFGLLLISCLMKISYCKEIKWQISHANNGYSQHVENAVEASRWNVQYVNSINLCRTGWSSACQFVKIFHQVYSLFIAVIFMTNTV